MTLLAPPVRYWVCPNCPVEDRTQRPDIHTQFHPCAGLNGLMAPLVERGTRAKVEVKEREDYIGEEQVQYHEGRPVMAVQTTREDGQDVTVFAPTANGRRE